jgi:hypothetical protein
MQDRRGRPDGNRRLTRPATYSILSDTRGASMKARKPLLRSLALAVCLSACSSTSPAPTLSPAPTTVLDGLLQRTPYPYSAPLPSPEPSALDGVFHKLEPGPIARAPCRRCPPYPPVGGEWRLQLDRGVFRVYHAGTGWATIGSFSVRGDRLFFYNDPHCVDATGTYTWRQKEDQLLLDAVSDDCGSYLRARALSGTPWTRE